MPKKNVNLQFDKSASQVYQVYKKCLKTENVDHFHYDDDVKVINVGTDTKFFGGFGMSLTVKVIPIEKNKCRVRIQATQQGLPFQMWVPKNKHILNNVLNAID